MTSLNCITDNNVVYQRVLIATRTKIRMYQHKHKPAKTCAMEINLPIETQEFNDRVCFLQSGITRETCNNCSESSSKSTTDEEIESNGEVGDGESSNADSKYSEEEGR